MIMQSVEINKNKLSTIITEYLHVTCILVVQNASNNSILIYSAKCFKSIPAKR